jgi:2,3-diaminopropionate biosynthesis protein SbnA
MDFHAMASLSPEELKHLVNRIGHTPLEPIALTIEGRERKVHLKLESANPTGSVKDRTGYALIKHFEDQGLLNEDSVIIESTSGNLGVALALVAKARGYQFIAVIDPKTTQENITKMQLFGAQIEMVDRPDANGGFLLSRLEHVAELCQRSKNLIWTNQYVNPANPTIHYTQTGPEIYQQMNEKVEAIFVSVSTGGTLSGIARFFREVSPKTLIIGIDAYGSVIFNTPPGPRKLTGIGSSKASHFITGDLYDAYVQVSDEDAFACCRSLYASTGLKVGGSSGAVLVGCAQYLATYPELVHVACVCADDGENYASSIFSDQWMLQQGFTLGIDHFRMSSMAVGLKQK